MLIEDFLESGVNLVVVSKVRPVTFDLEAVGGEGVLGLFYAVFAGAENDDLGAVFAENAGGL